MPQLIGIQAEGSAYLFQAWQSSENLLEKPPISAQTIADSISAGLPRDRLKAMAAVTETGGAFITVSDEAILAAIPTLARETGIFAEPAAAAAYAGLLKAIETGQVESDEIVVVVITGSGLKDVAAAVQGTQQLGIKAYTIEPELSAVEAVRRQSSMNQAD
jgi:threonine synthase